MRLPFFPLLAGALFLSPVTPLPADMHGEEEAPPVLELTEVRRPSQAFLEYGDVAGLPAATFEELGIVPGQAVKFSVPEGRSIGLHTRVFGSQEGAVYLKQTLRNVLGIEDGPQVIHARKIEWPEETGGGQSAVFTEVIRTPVAFLDYGDAVGLSLAAMEKLGAAPGMTARVSGPGGSAEVDVRLQDRGEEAILMRLALRNRLGVRDAAGQHVELEMLPSEADVITSLELTWMPLAEAAALARQTGRPLLAVVNGPHENGVRLVLEESGLRGLAVHCHLTEIDPEEQAVIASRFGVEAETSVVLATGAGQVITALEGPVDTGKLEEAIEAALRAE